MKIMLFVLLFALGHSTFASCEEDFKKYRLNAPLSPFRALGVGAVQVGTGALSSTGGLIAGTTLLNRDYSSAGVLYGSAMIYEAQYGLAKAFNDVKFYQSRMNVLAIIQEAKQGFGAALQQFYWEVVGPEFRDQIPMDLVVKILLAADEDRVFCQSKETLYTMFNLKKRIKRTLGFF